MKPLTHGTRSAYVQGCHCAPCTQANADYQRVYMKGRYKPTGNPVGRPRKVAA